MIKLIDILFENESSDIFVPRRLVDRRVRLNKLTQQEVDRMVGEYNRNPTKFHPGKTLSLSNNAKLDYPDISLNGDFVVPDSLKLVEGDFILESSNVTKLPDDLIVWGHLTVENCKKLTELPSRLQTERVWGEYSGLIKIPDDIICNELHLQKTKVVELPIFKNNIDYIDLEITKFKRLPEGFTNCNRLDISLTDIEEIPNNVKVTSLNASNCLRLLSVGSGCEFQELNLVGCFSLQTVSNDLKADSVYLYGGSSTPFLSEYIKKYKSKAGIEKALSNDYKGVKRFFYSDEKSTR